jgi:hypothetical protein
MNNISYEAIKIAFANDTDIAENCDPNNEDKSQDGVAKDVYEKIVEYEELFDGNFIVLNSDGKDVGFVYCLPRLLVSFGVNKQYRTKEFLPVVFDTIKQNAGEEFESFMWSRNTRAIQWLKKCGMTEEFFENDQVKKLIYTKCQ